MVSVLVAEQNNAVRQQVVSAMKEMHYHVLESDGYSGALDALSDNHVDLVLADVNAGACELCQDLRQANDAVAFIVLLSDASPRDKRIIYRAKADGYLEIPFDVEELQMRVKNLLWRCHIEDSAVVEYGNCRLHTDTYSLEVEGDIMELRRMEFLLLEKLLSYPGRIFTRAQLMDDLWGYDCESNPRTVDTHIRLLRKKLKGVATIRIQTIRGLGYRAAVPKQGKK